MKVTFHVKHSASNKQIKFLEKRLPRQTLKLEISIKYAWNE